MPKYKLTYFDVRGRAEMTRMAFAAGGIEFEDCRVKREEWAALKPSKLKIVKSQSHLQSLYDGCVLLYTYNFILNFFNHSYPKRYTHISENDISIAQVHNQPEHFLYIIYTAYTPIPLDGVSTTFMAFLKNL